MSGLVVGARYGRYEIAGRLGAGGMAEVYRARDLTLGRQVALKVLAGPATWDAQRVARLRREATAASALNHPNIVTIYDVGEAGGCVYIALELVDGRTIRDLLASGPLALAAGVTIAAQIAEGLAKAHATGIVHRDLKPENVMITSDDLVKIVDFGLAKVTFTDDVASAVATTVATQQGALLGTVDYMSPEQASGGSADYRSDQFALGVILYEMITGRHPFRRATAAQTLSAIIESPPATPDINLPEGRRVAEIIERCLAKQPAARYASTRDLARDLGAVVRRLSGASSDGGTVRSRARRRVSIDSIAVLPFVNATGDADADYVSDGVTESIINALSGLPGVKVMARSTVFRYRSRTDDARQVGRELGVRATVTGRVQMRGDMFRMTIEVADVEDGTHLWGALYDRGLSELSTIQDVVSGDITTALQLRRHAAARMRPAPARALSTIAYENYLRGRFFWNKRSPDGVRRAVEYFRRATETDPHFALAYVGLADAYSVLGASEFAIVSPRDIMPRAREAALRAVELDDTLAEAFIALATVKFWFDWDWRGAEADFTRALSLNAGYATAHLWYAEFLAAMQRFDEAIVEARKATELDPLSVTAYWTLGRVLNFSRDYRGVLREMETAFELDPTFDRLFYIAAWAHISLGEVQTGLQLMRDAVSAGGGAVMFKKVLLAHFCGVAGHLDEARRVAAEVKHHAESNVVRPFDMAVLHIGLGEYNTAFEFLDRAVAERSSWMAYLEVTPLLDPVRHDSRFAQLLRRVGLP